MLSFELCEILKNTYFVEDLQTTASEYFVGFTFFVMKILVIFTKQSKIFIILANNMGCLSEPYLFNFFRGCLLQILLGTFLNTLDHITLSRFLESDTFDFWLSQTQNIYFYTLHIMENVLESWIIFANSSFYSHFIREFSRILFDVWYGYVIIFELYMYTDLCNGCSIEVN